MSPAKHQRVEHHVLIINEGKDQRVIALDAAAYSVGRDSSNAIVIDSNTISRQHAMLVRLPLPRGRGYRYRLVDGNSQGKPSANGVFVNGKRCTSHDLVKGDAITFGRKIKASYLTLAMGEAEFVKYLESTSFHSLKSDVVDPKSTLMSDDLAPREATRVSPMNTTIPAPMDTIPEMQSNGMHKVTAKQTQRGTLSLDDSSNKRLSMVVLLGVGSMIAIAAGLGVWWVSGGNTPGEDNQTGSVTNQVSQ